MPDHVFISYSRDDQEFVLKLMADLEKQGIRVWLDQGDIRAGEAWRAKIVDSIENCAVFLIVLSPNAVASHNVVKELSIADSIQKRIIPVVYKTCELTAEMKYQLTGVQLLDFTQGSYRENLARLVEVLQEILDASLTSIIASTTSVSRSRVAKGIPYMVRRLIEGRPILVVGSFMILLLLVAIGTFIGNYLGEGRTVKSFTETAQVIMPTTANYETAKAVALRGTQNAKLQTTQTVQANLLETAKSSTAEVAATQLKATEIIQAQRTGTAIYLLTAIPEPTHTSPPSTPEPLEILEIAKKWPLIYKDPFETDRGIWEIGYIDDGWERGYLKIENGKYRWELDSIRDDALRYTSPFIDPIADFYLTAEVKLINGSGDFLRYGLLFRRDGGNYYTFRIENGPYFRVRKRINQEWSTLIDWSQAYGIYPGETIKLTVIAYGSHFYFFIGDRFAAELEDDSLPQGNVGLVATMSRAGDEAILEFDNFELRQKP